MDKPFAITLDVGSSLANHTGSWRTHRPQYARHLPPCNEACPAGENVQGWLYHAESGQYETAWRALVEDNPFPAVTGRVCYHPCESACNRGQLDAPVGIHAVERFLGDSAIAQGWRFALPAAPSGKRILVVGAGPSGLSAAYHLARMGHAVEVRDAGPLAGGMLRFGIPKYRLPRDILDAEVQRIVELGVKLVLQSKVEHVLHERDAGGFDAVFVATGAHLARRAWVPAGEAGRILDALTVLEQVELGSPPLLGRRVVVYGGGNTALDVARTARRLGAEEAVIVYRRTRERMPAHESEVREAEEEGVLFRWLSTIRTLPSAGADGHLTVEKMALDDKGFPQPTGEFDTIEADSLVLALGQDADLSLLDDVPGATVEDGVIQVDGTMMTGCPGVFAGGDMVPAARTVTVAIGHGKQAARHIDAWLRGLNADPLPKHPAATWARINPWYYTDAPRTLQPELERARRQSGFDEVVAGLSADNALFEARRCLSCGNCFECDNCYGVCPDNAVIKLGAGQGFRINLDYCKGCGLCAAECPCGAIDMVPEQR